MKMRRHVWAYALGLALTAGLLVTAHGCGNKNDDMQPPPSIQNINASTTPTSPVGLPIEINGSGFQAAPGKVTFTQGNITKDVVPAAAAWSDTGLVVTVPAGDGTTNFMIPSTVNVTVTTAYGTSNAVALNLIQTLSFSPSNLAWTTTTALPAAKTGMRAVPVMGASATSAFAVVTGGKDATGNTSSVWTSALAVNGTLGAWSTSPNSLPAARAHHAMVAADPSNSLVAAGARFVYVLGGQAAATDAPGGTNTVDIASVDPATGAVGAWQTSTSTLPQSLVGHSATVYNGYVYVAGGLTSAGMPTNTVYSAPINADGTLGAWTTSTNTLTTATSFGMLFGFGGKLYFVSGDTGSSTTPNNQDNTGTSNVYYASVSRGTVGVWTSTSAINKAHPKGNIWPAFGQIIVGEGIYSGSPGASELAVSTVGADSTLGSWNGLTGSNKPSANVYNATGFVSPLISATQTPRFLILGGQTFTGGSGAGGALSASVYVNSAP